MSNTTVNTPAISIQGNIAIQGHEVNVVIHADTATEVHEHLAGLLGNGQVGDQTAKKAGKSSGKGSAKKTQTADTAAENTTTAEDSAPAAEQSKPTGPVHEEAKQEAPANPTPADPEPTPTAQPTPAETATAPEATATPSASATVEPKVTPAECLAKGKELLKLKDGEAKLQAIVKKHGVGRITTTPPEKLDDVYADLCAELGEDEGGLL